MPAASTIVSRPGGANSAVGRRAQSTTGPARKTASKPTSRGGPVGGATAAAARNTPPVPQAMNGASPFEIMASRIANRVAEMAETVTFTERPMPKGADNQGPVNGQASRRPPRKLEIRLPAADATGVKFSAPFLDNLLGKMLALQNRMLATGGNIAGTSVDDSIKREQFDQSAELSRIIALICAEKARQGVVDKK